MKFLLFIIAFFTAANLLEAQQRSCREGPGVLKIIKENNDPRTCNFRTGNYYRIEGTAAADKTLASYFRQYQKGNPRPLEEVKEFRVQNCREAEEALHTAITKNGNMLVETKKWFFWKGDQNNFLSIVEKAMKDFKQDTDINRSLSILEAMIKKYKDNMDMWSSFEEN